MANRVQLSPEYFPNPVIGRPLSNADIYVGVIDLDPKIEANQKQISVLQEDGTTVDVSQPVSTNGGGVPVYNGEYVTILVDGSYSLRVDDKNGAQIYYIPKNSEIESLGSVDNIDDLRAITDEPADGDVLPVLGYYTPGDGGGGRFYWDSTSVDADNNGTIFKLSTIATGRFIRLVDDVQIVNVLWFGAYRDKTEGLKTIIAITGAVDYAASLVTTYAALPAGIGTGSQFTIFFPSGNYLIDSTINTTNYIRIKGQGSVITASADSFDILTGLKYNTEISGITFAQGRAAAYIITSNADSAKIDFIDCEFHEQLTNVIYDDTLSASTYLNITRCKVYNTRAAKVLDIGSNKASLVDSWISASGSPVFKISSTCSLHLERVLLVPIGAGVKIWAENYGFFSANNCRFGGESAATIVVNEGTIDDSALFRGVSINDCEVFSAGVAAVLFEEVPNIFIWHNNRGMVDSTGFEFSAGITDSANIKSTLCSYSIDSMQLSTQFISGLVTAANKVNFLKKEAIHGSKNIIDTDKVLQIRSNDNVQHGYTGSITNITAGTTTNIFGSPARSFVGTTATHNGSFFELWVTAFNGLSSGVYTVVYDIEVDGVLPAQCIVNSGDNETSLLLSTGKHVVSIPTYFIVGEGETVGYSASNINNSQSIIFSNIRIFSGEVEVDTQNNNMFGAGTAPATLLWEVGDVIRKAAPTAGTAQGIICTTAGLAGAAVWTALPNI